MMVQDGSGWHLDGIGLSDPFGNLPKNLGPRSSLGKKI